MDLNKKLFEGWKELYTRIFIDKDGNMLVCYLEDEFVHYTVRDKRGFSADGGQVECDSNRESSIREFCEYMQFTPVLEITDRDSVEDLVENLYHIDCWSTDVEVGIRQVLRVHTDENIACETITK